MHLVNFYNVKDYKLEKRKMIQSQQMNIAQLLQMTLVADTFEIREAERKLSSLYSDQHFVIKLMGVPKDVSVPYNIRKAAVLYTTTYCKNMELGKSQQKLTDISKYLFMQLAQDSLQIKLRKHLIATLSYLISLDKNSRIKSIFYEESLQNAQKVFLNMENLVNFNSIIFVGLAVQVVLTVSVHTTKQLIQFIRNSFVYCVGIADRLYEPAEKAVENDNRDNLLEIFCIMKIYSQCIKMYLKKIAYSDSQTVKQLFEPIFCQLLGRIWDFTLKQNSISDNIIYYTRKYDNQISQQYHNIKADYAQVLSTMMRTIFQYYKDPKILSTHPIIKNKDLLLILINSIYSINLYCPHYHIHSPSLIKLMEEILNCILLAVKSNYYYDILVDKKKQLIQSCIFKILDFSQDSYELLQSDPQEFINQVFQIIDMDPSEFINNRKKQFDLVDIAIDDIEDYTTLRTVAATLLSHYCKNIDGTLSDILTFICFSIKNEKKTQFSLSTLMLILGILRDQILDRQQQSLEVVKILILKLYKSELPKQIADMGPHKEKKKSDNLQYMMTLLCIYKYISKQRKKGKNREYQQLEGEIYKLNKVIVRLIGEKEIEQGVRLIAYDIVTAIIRLDDDDRYTLQYIKMIKRLLVDQVENRGKKLDILYNIFKFKDDEILSASFEEGMNEDNESENIIIDILDALRLTIVSQIDNQLELNKDIVCKCWNIISDICQNQKYLTFHNSYVVENASLSNGNGKLVEKISQTLLTLSEYIDGKNSLQYDEQLIMCLNSVITQTKAISHTQMATFQIIPRLFYNKYSYQFEGLFQTILLYLKYGSNFVNSVAQYNSNTCTMLHIIIQMCIKNMNRVQHLGKNKSESKQDQSIQGTLLLQNIILNFGGVINKEEYQLIMMQVYRKLNEIVLVEKKSKQESMEGCEERNKQKCLIKSNLICLASLALVSSYTLFTQQDCRAMMEQIAKNLDCFTENYNKKIILITLTEMLMKPQLGFVAPYLVTIIKTIVKLSKESKKNEEVEHENFRARCSNIMKQYQNCMVHLEKGIEQINEIQNSKEKIIMFKQKYQQLWQNIIKQLLQQDIHNLKQLMGRVKVKNESRQIFKIKR